MQPLQRQVLVSDLLDLWLAQTQSPCPTRTGFQNKGKPVHLVKIPGRHRGNALHIQSRKKKDAGAKPCAKLESARHQKGSPTSF